MTDKESISNNILLVLSGPSGSGKNTLINCIISHRQGAVHGTSVTTRMPRSYEKDGVDYFFRTREEFAKMIEENGLIEWDVYRDNYYGTPVFDIREKLASGRNVVLDITIPGARNVKKMFGDNACTVFILPPSIRKLRKRLYDRKGESAEVIEKRIRFAVESEISRYCEFDYVIVNDDLETACRDILDIYDSLTSGRAEAVAAAEAFKAENCAGLAAGKLEELLREIDGVLRCGAGSEGKGAECGESCSGGACCEEDQSGGVQSIGVQSKGVQSKGTQCKGAQCKEAQSGDS
ncbi:MAG: guanylate kinase [Clostridia bacterium]|nr:guanylate kinase [Clostridia bacterium]